MPNVLDASARVDYSRGGCGSALGGKTASNTVVIPAKFAADVAAGSVALMSTAAGTTTTLVGATGIVGTATLVEVSAAGAAGAAGAGAAGAGAAAGGGTGGAAAAAGSVALGPILLGVGVVALLGVGIYLWRRNKKVAQEKMVEVTIECDESNAEAVIAEVHSIVEAAAAKLAREQDAA